MRRRRFLACSPFHARQLLVAAAVLLLGGGCGGAADDGLFGAATGAGPGGSGAGGPGGATAGSGGGSTTTSGAGGAATTTSGAGGAATTTSGAGGAATTTSGAGGAATTTTSAGGAGGSHPAVEVECLNGLDDDLDGAIDCADTDCQSAGFQCLAAPAGALGVFVPANGACPVGTTARAFGSCAGAACSCSGTSASCSFQLKRWNFDDCASGQPSGLKTADGCYYVNAGTNSAFLGTSSANGGASCLPEAAAVPSTPRPMCQVVSVGGCAGGACLSPSIALDDACVLLAVGSACAAPFDAYSEAVSDQVGAACGCGCTKTSETCSSTVTAYEDQSCKSPTGASAPIDGVCHPLGPLGSYYLAAGFASPICAPSATLAVASGVLCCRKPPP